MVKKMALNESCEGEDVADVAKEEDLLINEKSSGETWADFGRYRVGP